MKQDNGISPRRDVTCLRNFVRDSLLWSFFFALLCSCASGMGRRDSRPRGGTSRREDASRRGRRRQPCRCSRSGVEDPTDGNARRNSGVLEGAGASVSLRSVIFSRYTKATPSPRCSRAGGVLSKVSLSSSTSCVSTLGRSRATFSASPLQLEHMRTTRTWDCTVCQNGLPLSIFKLYFTHKRIFTGVTWKINYIFHNSNIKDIYLFKKLKYTYM